MKKITSFLLLALSTFFMHNSAEAQGSQVYVQLDSITDGRLNVVIRDTATGNFIGFTDNSSQSNSNQMLMLDSIGNVIWSKDVHGNIGVSEIVRASDGNYIAGGTHQYSSYNRVFAWKITPQGNSVWFRDMSEGSAGSFAGLAATSDGGCVITGTSTYTKSFWIRLTGSGATAVQREIDITVGNTNQCVGVVHTADNCFVGALNVNYGAFDSDTWIYKMDTSGTLVWLRSFDAPNQNTPKKIIQASDGGFIILSHSSATETNNMNTNSTIFRTDTAGHLLWAKSYIHATFVSTTFPLAITETPDHGILVFSSSSSECFMLRLDSAGTKLWCKSLENNFSTASVYVTPWDAVCLAGRFHYNAGNINKAAFLRLEDDSALICTMTAYVWTEVAFTPVEASPVIATPTPSFGNSPYTAIITTTVITPVRTLICSDLSTEIPEEDPSAGTTAYPNPATTTVTIQLNFITAGLKLLVVDGQGRVIDAQYAIGDNQINLDLSGWSSGIYFYSATNEGGKVQNGKFVVE